MPQQLSRTSGASRRALAVTAAMLLAGALAARAQSRSVTHENVETAVKRAIEYVISQRNSDGHWDPTIPEQYRGGNTALACLALLYAGIDPRSAELTPALDWLSKQDVELTYVSGLRAHVLALTPQAQYRERLAKDVNWLLAAVQPRGSNNSGLYGYRSAKAGESWVDHSNSQLGVLGLWMASEAGVGVQRMESFWPLIEDRWISNQNNDGGWGYQRGQSSTGSMTVAGLATLHVVLDRRYPSAARRSKRLEQAIGDGLDWIGRSFDTENPQGATSWKFYYLYGVERAGRASGRKYFGGREWFRTGAANLLETQNSDGSWPASGMTSLQNTAMALMFLCHGRAPLLLCKLEHDDDWDTHLRDAAQLTRFCERTLERLLNWQIVSLEGPTDDLLEAPLLLLTGRKSWQFDQAQIYKLREYVERGGLILAAPAQANTGFATSMRLLAERLFPTVPLRAVGEDHPLVDGALQHKIEPLPQLFEAKRGVRTLMLLSEDPLPQGWATGRTNIRERDFLLGQNMYLLATDKTTPPSRLDSPQIPLRSTPTKRTISVARIQHSGDWDVEPYGWSRLQAHMNNEAQTRVIVTDEITADKLDADSFRVAHITGTGEFSFSSAERAGLRRFLTGGGTLISDAAGGSAAFSESLLRELREVLRTEPAMLSRGASLVTGAGLLDGVDLRPVQHRRSARGGGRDFPVLQVFVLGGRVAVVHSPLDLSVGLLGTQVYGCNGYAPQSCLEIFRNVLLYGELSTLQKSGLAR